MGRNARVVGLVVVSVLLCVSSADEGRGRGSKGWGASMAALCEAGFPSDSCDGGARRDQSNSSPRSLTITSPKEGSVHMGDFWVTFEVSGGMVAADVGLSVDGGVQTWGITYSKPDRPNTVTGRIAVAALKPAGIHTLALQARDGTLQAHTTVLSQDKPVGISIAIPGQYEVVRHAPPFTKLHIELSIRSVVCPEGGIISLYLLPANAPKEFDRMVLYTGSRKSMGGKAFFLTTVHSDPLPTGAYRLDLEYSNKNDSIFDVPLQSRTFTLVEDPSMAHTPDKEEPAYCPRENPAERGVRPRVCRGCRMIAVKDNVAISECTQDNVLDEDISGPTRVDGLLAVDIHEQERAVSAMFAVAEMVLREPGVTLAITSCGRLELLHQTLGSFFAANLYPIEHVIIIDDSGDPNVCAAIRLMYGNAHYDKAFLHWAGRPDVNVLCNEARIGQMRSVDRLYAHVRTWYVFHLEDDWEFDSASGHFIHDSMDILHDHDDCFQVHVRRRSSSIHPVHRTLFQSSTRGVAYRRLLWDWWACGSDYAGIRWHGFSLGPGLRRLHHIRQIGSMEAVGSEIGAQAAFQSLGLWAAALENGVAEHIGDSVSRRFQWETSLQ